MDGTKICDISTLSPQVVCEGSVPGQWINTSGHMSAVNFTLAFDQASSLVLDLMGLGFKKHKAVQAAPFLMEMHTVYLRELKLGDPYSISFQLLGHNAKRVHYFMFMHHRKEEFLSATVELMIAFMGLENRKIISFPSNVSKRLSDIYTAQKNLPIPVQAGRSIDW